MRKIRCLILMFMIMVLMPIYVEAAGITVTDCLDGNNAAVEGAIEATLIETGDKDNVGGKIKFDAVTGVSATFTAQAHKNEKLTKITYILYDDEKKEVCKGTIEGSGMNYPSAKFKISFKKVTPHQLEICLATNENHSECKKDKIPDNKGAGITIGSNGNTIGENGLDPDDITSSTICKKGEDGLFDFIHKYWGYLMVCVPLLLMIVMVIDFLKALTGNDADALKKCGNNSIKRVLATVILLLLPLVVRTVFNLVGIGEFLCF